jgi:GAF domain-containing protein
LVSRSLPQSYRALEEEHASKHAAYFRLHQLIAANRRDFAALGEAAEAAASAAERDRLEAEVERLWRRRGQRVERWDAAFQVLDAELRAIRARLGEYEAAAARAPSARRHPAATAHSVEII